MHTSSRSRSLTSVIVGLTYMIVLINPCSTLSQEQNELPFVLRNNNPKANCDSLFNVFVDLFDLANDDAIRSVIQRVSKSQKEKCPSLKKLSFTIDHKSRMNESFIYLAYAEIQVEVDNQTGAINRYINRPLDRKKKREEQKAERHRAALAKAAHDEQVRLESERKALELRQKKQNTLIAFQEFSSRNSVEEWPEAQGFFANPFLYEGKIIGLEATFETMISRTTALFSLNETAILFSEIQNSMFVRKTKVLVAGRVLGKEYVKLPVLGDVLVPHLAFYGVYFCETNDCNEILLWQQ